MERIITGGLDPRRGGQSTGRLFGLASYLACNASKADLYTDANLKTPESSKQEERKIIVIRAALGDCFRTTQGMPLCTYPPDDCDGRPMDSVVAETQANGGCVDHLEVMLYKETQMLPVAVVTYRHDWNCVCALCKRRQ